MNLRTKKTLRTLVTGAIVITFWTVYDLARGRHLGLNPVFFGMVAVYLAGAGYTWWWYGDSPKAVAMRAKAEDKREAARQRESGRPIV
ncbi:hypothetical protein [Streptomyces sp. TLI_171]|uniref:hypothetical protein n=1 Tax=Streptomyces sp. TLI_171 TaxID=1938859 RepID=UPI000C18E51D|nr:hypothetical protein [Streptomyces sp. TLI_171]RKE05005.1 hypothetical protein BX266_7244 [Streptomyces sp. TLI_171]